MSTTVQKDYDKGTFPSDMNPLHFRMFVRNATFDSRFFPRTHDFVDTCLCIMTPRVRQDLMADNSNIFNIFLIIFSVSVPTTLKTIVLILSLNLCHAYKLKQKVAHSSEARKSKTRMQYTATPRQSVNISVF